MAKSLTIKVSRYDLKEDFTRTKYYELVDITNSVQQPITTVARTDTALDTASITILNKDKEPLKPFTRIKIEFIEVAGLLGQTTTQYWLVENDKVDITKYSADESKRVYKHQVALIEPTKWLERFDVDNTTITNMLMFLYQDEGVASDFASFSRTETGVPSFPDTYFPETSAIVDQKELGHFYQYVSNASNTIDTGNKMQTTIRFWAGLFHKDIVATQTAFSVVYPDGTEHALTIGQQTLSLGAGADYGTYTFKQTYYATHLNMWWELYYQWNVTLVEYQTYTDKLPKRYTIEDVIDKVLGKVTRENSVCLKSETPLFSLDQSQRETLRGFTAPEFTFTQSTLFGVLAEIGTAIHAIPRLMISDNAGLDWSTIHFDFLGFQEEAQNPGQVQINYEKTQRSDNYTTAFVSNVQNAFVSSTSAYITITEPYSDGYISTRTESSDFEITNNSACIKVSRPIQRIVELLCFIYNEDDSLGLELDISKYCLEKTNFSLLQDYELNAASQNWAQGKKDGNLYYTRGDNVIRNLDYIAPTSVYVTNSAFNNDKLPAIKNILVLALQSSGYYSASDAYNFVKDINLKDICFRVKYVPYLNLKVKQFRDVVEDEMETSTLFFNQNGQQVDINAFGERIKAALNMTANQEPTISYLTRLPFVHIDQGQFKIFDKVIGQYIPYEVHREISNKNTLTSIVYSKDFNKWNEYDAIKKNFREWEISENECIEQNPIYNQFCIIGDDADFDNIEILAPDDDNYQTVKTSLQEYAAVLNAKEGFIAAASSIMNALFGTTLTNLTIEWMMAEFEGEEWDGANQEYISVKQRVLFPTTAFALGNAIVMNVATKDNYSAGTTSESYGSSLISSKVNLEKDIPYGTKYGKADTMKISLGHGNYGSTAIADIIPAAQKLYLLDSNANPNSGVVKIWNDPLVINKDSRQMVNLTLQLNFISEKDYIWVSSMLPQHCGFTGQENNALRLAFFNTKPSRFFNNEMDMVIVNSNLTTSQYNITTYGLNLPTPTYKINFSSTHRAGADYVGWGIIDSNNKVILYYNKAIKNGEIPPTLYFQFRDKI